MVPSTASLVQLLNTVHKKRKAQRDRSNGKLPSNEEMEEEQEEEGEEEEELSNDENGTTGQKNADGVKAKDKRGERNAGDQQNSGGLGPNCYNLKNDLQCSTCIPNFIYISYLLLEI